MDSRKGGSSSKSESKATPGSGVCAFADSSLSSAFRLGKCGLARTSCGFPWPSDLMWVFRERLIELRLAAWGGVSRVEAAFWRAKRTVLLFSGEILGFLRTWLSDGLGLVWSYSCAMDLTPYGSSGSTGVPDSLIWGCGLFLWTSFLLSRLDGCFLPLSFFFLISAQQLMWILTEKTSD